MRVFEYMAYAMVPEEQRGKLNAKDTICLFLRCCKGTKVYKLMCVQAKKIIKSRDILFMKDNMNDINDLEMHPYRKNENHMVNAMDKFSKSSLVDLGEDIEE